MNQRLPESGKKRAVRLPVLLAVLSLMVTTWSCAQRGEHVLDTWEPIDAPVKIRIKKFDEWPPISPAPHYYYVLESKPDRQWHEIVEWRIDDPIPIPKEQVRFLGSHVAYMFLRERYVVTTDGGRAWSSWDAQRSFPSLRIPVVVGVELDQTGRGSLFLKYLTAGDYSTMTLETTDYGVRWATPH